MKKILTGLLLIINLTCFSQSIEELEYELSYHLSGEEWGNKKNVAKKLLEIDSLNARAIKYLVEVYGRNDQRDSIKYLYEKLIKDNRVHFMTSD